MRNGCQKAMGPLFWINLLAKHVVDICNEQGVRESDYELVIEAMIDDLSPEQRHTLAGVMMTAKRKIYNLAIMDQLTHL